MRIESLSLKNFRNYDKLSISFNDNLNIIIGDNAQGKTNILEAIYYLSITKSFLGIKDDMVINKNFVSSLINGSIIDNENKRKLAILLNNDGKKIWINDKEIKKHSEYIGNLKVIIFSPENVRHLRESPGNRRKFLNIEISQLYNKYVSLLNNYNVILKQRNEYLKYIKNNGKCNNDYLDILNSKYVSLSCEIIKYRNDFVNDINKFIENIFFEISGYNGLKLKYITCIDINDLDIMEQNLMEKLKSSFDREVLYGGTLLGPHRDDFCFYLNESDLYTYGSQGQVKMAILALRLSEIDVFKLSCGENPILLLDDIFSELDINKRNRLLKYLNIDIQSIITTTDLENIDNEYLKNANIYTIEDGKIINNDCV